MEEVKKKIRVLTVLVSLALLLSVLSFAGTVMTYSKLKAGSAAADSDGAAAGDNPSAKVAVSADDDPVMGNKNAPVTVISFTDFQCPYCARFVLQTFPQIKKNFIDTGKVKFVLRDFPLPFHEFSAKAHEAAECADDQSKFWEMHDLLFSNQDKLSITDLKGYAKSLGLDQTKFDSCLDSGKYTSEIQKDISDGAAAGVSGTPSFFINGQMLVGAQPYSAFEQAINAALK